MPPSPPSPPRARLLAGLAVAVLLGLCAQVVVVGSALARGWPRWRAAAAEDLRATLSAKTPAASQAAPLEASARGPVTEAQPEAGPQRDPSCKWLADNLRAAGQRLEKRGLTDPVPAGEREAAVGHHGCSPDDPAVHAMFERYAAAYRDAGLSLPGHIFPGGG